MVHHKDTPQLSTKGFWALVGCGSVIISGFIVAFWLTLVVGGLGWLWWSLDSAVFPHGRQPGEVELLERFHEHLDELNELVKMIQEDDRLYTLHADGRYEGNALHTSRVEAYCGLLEACECLSIERLDPYGAPVVQILIWAGGAFPGGGKYIYYVYAPDGLPEGFCDHDVGSMADIDLGNEPWETHCWPIEGDWFMKLFY